MYNLKNLIHQEIKLYIFCLNYKFLSIMLYIIFYDWH